MNEYLLGFIVGAVVVFMIRVLKMMGEGLELKKLQLKKEGKL